MPKIALFIGRFQPCHIGHIDAIKQIKAKGFQTIFIGIGSANKEFTSDNPFTYQEREKMMKILIDKSNFKEIEFKYFAIPDLGNDNKWKNYILENLPKFDSIATGNQRVKDIFEKQGIGNIDIELRGTTKASHVRRQILLRKNSKVENAVGKDILEYLHEINASDRFKSIYQNEMISPKLAVDGIIVDSKNNIILIRRKNAPLGYALPGGLIDYGESPEDALIREMKEEIGVNIQIENLLSVYGDPNRDPRGHVISITYIAKIIGGKLKAGDDAKELLLLDLNKTDEIQLAFDHKNIINDYKNCIQ